MLQEPRTAACDAFELFIGGAAASLIRAVVDDDVQHGVC